MEIRLNIWYSGVNFIKFYKLYLKVLLINLNLSDIKNLCFVLTKISENDSSFKIDL